MKVQGQHIHCIGIGGIGVSAVAGLCRALGAQVSGCDARESDQLQALRARGLRCWSGHSPEHLAGVDAVVYSSAIRADNPEMRAVRALGLPCYSRAQMLAVLQQGYSTIAIAGAHGKTTTTWLAAHVLMAAGLDPSVMVGGHVSPLGGNWRLGRGRHFVIEVDESDGSLLEFRPSISIITNIDREHLDYYRDMNHIRQTFARYVCQTRPDGCLIICSDDAEADALCACWRGRTIRYGLCGERGPEFSIQALALGPRHSTFEVCRGGQSLGRAMLSLPGEHNVQNALSTFALAHVLDIPFEVVAGALARVDGVGRRLQHVGECAGVTVLDDYAHHPREVKATVKAARRMAAGRLIGVFQPHRYSRTLHLAADFGDAFDGVDLLVLAPVYAASEEPIEGVSSQLIADAVGRRGRVACYMAASVEDIASELAQVVRQGDTVITLGAGDVHLVGRDLLRMLGSKSTVNLAGVHTE